MDLSIIIVNWNTKDYLEQCLRSIFEHTKDIEYEVFVIDNASTDGSPQMVKEKFPQVKLIENKENVGFAKANNQAVKIVRGYYVFLLNPDTLIVNNSIEKMVNFFEEHKEAGIVGARLIDERGRWDEGWGKFPTVASEIIPTAMHKLFLPQRIIDINKKEFVDVDWVGGAALMFRKSLAEENILLDEEFFMYSEETDLCFKVKKMGYKIYGLVNTSIIHYQEKSAMQNFRNMKIQILKGKFKFFRKNKNYFYALTFKLLFFFKVFCQILFGLVLILIKPAEYRSRFQKIFFKLFLLKTVLLNCW